MASDTKKTTPEVPAEAIALATKIRVNQRWGERQITEIRAAGIRDRGWPLGSILICWTVHAGKWGTCSERAFRQWIKRNRATLRGGVA